MGRLMPHYRARPATLHDAEAIARIYNEGIRDRVGTFETRERSIDDVRGWFDGRHPIVVVEDGIHLDRARTSLARNVDLVERVHALLELSGRTAMTPADYRRTVLGREVAG